MKWINVVLTIIAFALGFMVMFSLLTGRDAFGIPSFPIRIAFHVTVLTSVTISLIRYHREKKKNDN